MKKILCIGSITYDITIPFDGFPMENTKNRVNNLLECGGGSASNAAYLLGKWGMKPYFAGALGNDTYGYKIFEEFKSAEVNCKYIEVDNQYETPVSIVIVNTNFGSRTVLSNHNPDLKIKRKKDIKADVILIDGQEYDASIRALNSNPKAISIIDAGRLTDNIVDLAKRVNYLVCSKNFAEDFTGIAFDFDQPATMILKL